MFLDCFASDGIAGVLYNRGYFTFSGPALFYNTDHPSVYVSPDGETVFSEDSVFWSIRETTSPAVKVASGGEVEVPSSVVFIHYNDGDCSTVYYDDACE